MNNLEKYDDAQNNSGIDLIELLPVTDISSFPNVINLKIDSGIEDIELIGGKSWISVYFTPETAYFSQPKEDNDAGCYFPTRIRCFIPKDRLEMMQFLQEADGNSFIAKIRDANGIYKVVGTPDQPLEISDNFSKDPQVSSSSGREMTLTGDLEQRSPVYL